MHEHDHPDTPASPEDQPARHGMLLFGEQTAYLSHFPMFHPPHDYQAIFEVTFAKAGTDPMATYVQDRREHPESKLYSWDPKNAFVLEHLVPSDVHHPQGSLVKGSLVRGHFERDGSFTILTDVKTNATNVVHFRRFDPQAQGLPQLEYVLIGKVQELFLTHLITKPPDFDQILSVRVTGHEFTDEELRQGVPIVVPGRANSMSDRIKEGEQVTAKAQRAGEDAPETVEIQVEADAEFYLEEGELRVPATFQPTEEEIAAGMP